MSLLSALLTQDQVVSPKAIDEAIQRQVISGGDFETCLLESNAVAEDTLAAYCGAVHGIAAEPRHALLVVERDVLSRVPVTLALRHAVLPLRVESARLVVAVAGPLLQLARDEIEAAAKLPITLRCVTPVRLAWGLAKHYGAPLAPRLQRIAMRLDAQPSGPMPAEISIPLTRPKPSRNSSPGITPLAALAAFDAAMADERDSAHPGESPESRTSLSSLRAGLAQHPALHTPAPDRASPPPRVTSPSAPTKGNTPPPARSPAPAPVRDTRTPSMPFVAPPLPPTPVTLPSATATVTPSAIATVVPATASAPPDRGTVLPAPMHTSEPPRAVDALRTSEPPRTNTPPSTRPLPKTLSKPSAPDDAPTMRPSAVSVPPFRSGAPMSASPSSPVMRASTPPPVVTLSMPLSLPPPPMVPSVPAPSDATRTQPGARGISHDVAMQRIEAAGDRDTVVEALLDHAYERFAWVGLFAVQGDQCVGIASRGGGVPVRDVSLSLTRPSVLRLAFESGAAEVTSLDASASDREVRARIARDEAVEAVVVPLRIGARVALLLWADQGPSSPSALAVRQLDAFAQRCAEAFARIIASRKQGRNVAPSRPSPAAGVTPVSRPARAPLPDRSARLDALRKAVDTQGDAPTPSQPDLAAPKAAVRMSPAPLAPSTSASVNAADEVVRAMLATNAVNDAQLATLVSLGEAGLDAVFAHFPGPHTIRRSEALARLPALAEAGPVLRAALAFRHAALPRLLTALESIDPDARYCALLCLGEVVHPSAIGLLLPRLTDTDYPTRMATIEVLRAYRRFEEFSAVLTSLRGTLRAGPGDARRSAAHALGELHDADAVEPLIAALADGDAALATAAHRALVVIARQDFGAVPAAWRQWWAGAAQRHRIEWLIDALVHAEPTIRHEASEELKRLTGQYFGYYFNLPRRERERAWQRYVEWWKTDGAARFEGISGAV